MESAKILVINIVTWNSARYLPDLFESLDRQTSQDFTVTVVDNASTDGTLEWLRDHRPDVVVLRNFRNQGFARAHNQAFALALSRWQGQDQSDRYCLTLNPDVILHPDCVRELILFMREHPEIDMAGPKLLRVARALSDAGERDEFELTSVIDSTGLVLRRSRLAVDRGAGEDDRGQYDALEPFGVSGAAMLLRASAVLRLKLRDEVFDEDFFAYKEDVDLSWRLRLLGGRAALVSNAVAWHERTARVAGEPGLLSAWLEQSRRPALVRRLSRRNQLWLEWKNDDLVNRLLHLPWLVPAIVLRSVSALTSLVLLKAAFEAWLGRGRVYVKRRELMRSRKVSAAEMRKWFQ